MLDVVIQYSTRVGPGASPIVEPCMGDLWGPARVFGALGSGRHTFWGGPGLKTAILMVVDELEYLGNDFG